MLYPVVVKTRNQLYDYLGSMVIIQDKAEDMGLASPFTVRFKVLTGSGTEVVAC
jgi:hypothetical protein